LVLLTDRARLGGVGGGRRSAPLPDASGASRAERRDRRSRPGPGRAGRGWRL